MNEPIFTIKTEEKSPDYGRFVIEPLEQGYGHTLGSALRRVLLTGLTGAAITQARISGVRHQFSTISGMKEDVAEFLLNLKKVRLSYQGEKPIKLTLSTKGKGDIKASDIKVPAGIKIANPDLVLATLSDKDAKLDVDLLAEVGVGYSQSEERKTGTVGLIPLDAVFSPVNRVNYRVEETRVGRLTNYDKLIFELWTDGTIGPDEALKKAAQILVSYFSQVVSPKLPKKKKEDREVVPAVVAKLSVEELGLPTRISNALTRGGYETIEDLAAVKPGELEKVRNLGQKSVKIITAALADKGVKFTQT